MIALLVCSCGAGGGHDVRVYSAASMTDAVGKLAQDFEGAGVTTSYGASSALARQIDDGAPADVYISASKAWVDFLDDEGLLIEPPVVIARNELVCLVTRDSMLKFASLRQLAANPPSEIAVADAGAPAGEYARQALKNAGYLDDLKPKLVGQKDVRAVLNAVRSGNAACGFVYATDAQAFKDDVRIAFKVDAGLHAPIAYYAGLIGDSQTARDFFLYMQGDKAQSELAKFGFRKP